MVYYGELSLIEIGDNVSDNDAFGVFSVNVTDDFCQIFVDDDSSAVQFISVGQTARQGLTQTMHLPLTEMTFSFILSV